MEENQEMEAESNVQLSEYRMEEVEDESNTQLITLSDDKASLVLNDLLSVVQDGSATDTLNNIDISFTCKVCKTEKSSLKELVEHLSAKSCESLLQSQQQGVKRKRGRPGRPPKVKTETPDEEYRPALEQTPVMQDSSSTGRHTRLKSGAMKRKSVLDLFNERIVGEDEVVTVEEIRDEPPKVKRGPGRPRKIPVEEKMLDKEIAEELEGMEERVVKQESVVMEVTGEEGEVLPKDRTLVVKLVKMEDEEEEEENIDAIATQQLTQECIGGEGEGQTEWMENEDTGDKPVVVLMRTKNKKKQFNIPKHYRKPHSNVHKCHKCHHRGFPTVQELEVHEQCHNNNDPTSADYYKCTECEFSHKVWARMLMHLITHEKYKSVFTKSDTMANIIGDFACPVCKKKFDRKANMIQHIGFMHNKKERVCEICAKVLHGVDEKSFQRHLDKCRNIEYRCEQCEYTTTVRENLRLHQKLHDGQGIQCEICHATFPTRQRYKTHCLTHQEDRPRYVCSTCGADFVSVDAMKKHCARFHTGITQREWSCDLCSYKGLLEYDLKKHKQQVHNKKHKCPDCAFSTNVEIAFKNHREYHNPDRIFVCPYSNCYCSFCTSEELASHISSAHNLQYKNQCPMCFRHFKKKTSLLRHLITHTNARPYFCAECGAKFYSHTTYYRHRHKTGHDAKREGVASVPQNITIQYLDDTDHRLPMPTGPQDVNGVLRQATEEAQMASVVQKGGLVRVTADPLPVISHESAPLPEETPVALASLLSQDGMDFNSKVIEVPIMDSSGEPRSVNLVTDGVTLEEEVVIQESATPLEEEAVTFVVQIQNEDGGEMREVVMTEQEMMQHLGGNQVVFQDMQPPVQEEEGEEYAVLMLPPGEGGGEPEAALSMLQLSTGPNLQ